MFVGFGLLAVSAILINPAMNYWAAMPTPLSAEERAYYLGRGWSDHATKADVLKRFGPPAYKSENVLGKIAVEDWVYELEPWWSFFHPTQVMYFFREDDLFGVRMFDDEKTRRLPYDPDTPTSVKFPPRDN